MIIQIIRVILVYLFLKLISYIKFYLIMDSHLTIISENSLFTADCDEKKQILNKKHELLKAKYKYLKRIFQIYEPNNKTLANNKKLSMKYRDSDWSNEQESTKCDKRIDAILSTGTSLLNEDIHVKQHKRKTYPSNEKVASVPCKDKIANKERTCRDSKHKVYAETGTDPNFIDNDIYSVRSSKRELKYVLNNDNTSNREGTIISTHTSIHQERKSRKCSRSLVENESSICSNQKSALISYNDKAHNDVSHTKIIKVRNDKVIANDSSTHINQAIKSNDNKLTTGIRSSKSMRVKNYDSISKNESSDYNNQRSSLKNESANDIQYSKSIKNKSHGKVDKNESSICTNQKSVSNIENDQLTNDIQSLKSIKVKSNSKVLKNESSICTNHNSTSKGVNNALSNDIPVSNNYMIDTVNLYDNKNSIVNSVSKTTTNRSDKTQVNKRDHTVSKGEIDKLPNQTFNQPISIKVGTDDRVGNKISNNIIGRKPSKFQLFLQRLFGLKTRNKNENGYRKKRTCRLVMRRRTRRRHEGNFKAGNLMKYCQSAQRCCLQDNTARQCPFNDCKMKFYGIINYNDHLNLCHFPQKKNTCYYCHEGFENASNKDQHESLHLGVSLKINEKIIEKTVQADRIISSKNQYNDPSINEAGNRITYREREGKEVFTHTFDTNEQNTFWNKQRSNLDSTFDSKDIPIMKYNNSKNKRINIVNKNGELKIHSKEESIIGDSTSRRFNYSRTTLFNINKKHSKRSGNQKTGVKDNSNKITSQTEPTKSFRNLNSSASKISESLKFYLSKQDVTSIKEEKHPMTTHKRKSKSNSASHKSVIVNDSSSTTNQGAPNDSRHELSKRNFSKLNVMNLSYKWISGTKIIHI